MSNKIKSKRNKKHNPLKTKAAQIVADGVKKAIEDNGGIADSRIVASLSHQELRRAFSQSLTASIVRVSPLDDADCDYVIGMVLASFDAIETGEPDAGDVRLIEHVAFTVQKFGLDMKHGKSSEIADRALVAVQKIKVRHVLHNAYRFSEDTKTPVIECINFYIEKIVAKLTVKELMRVGDSVANAKNLVNVFGEVAA